MENNHHFWRNYAPWFGQPAIDEVTGTVAEVRIDSFGGRIHLDVYPQASPNRAGTIVFSHGIAGYGRLVSPFALRLWKRGFNVICPDLAGYGFNEGRRGDWLWEQFIQNLLDALNYARQRFDGPLFLAGASLGGTLAYHAACRVQDLTAVACYCFFDYRHTRFLREVSTTGPSTPLARPIIGAAARLWPMLQLPAEMVVPYRYVAEDPAFVALLRRDPCADTISSGLNARKPLSRSQTAVTGRSSPGSWTLWWGRWQTGSSGTLAEFVGYRFSAVPARHMPSPHVAPDLEKKRHSSHRQHHSTKRLPRSHVAVRLCCLRQRESAVHHGPNRAVGQPREDLPIGRTDDLAWYGKQVESIYIHWLEQVEDIQRSARAGRVAHHHQPPTGGQSPEDLGHYVATQGV